jgi:outer membrane protein OmpA-like peptidoglycan-associated protein
VTAARPVVVFFAAVAVAALSACGPARVRTIQAPGQDLVVLLPEPDGSSGRAVVSNPSGSVNLSAPRHATVISPNQPPAPVTTLTAAEIEQLFDETISALPLPPQHFTLYFQFDSDELTEESRALLPKIRRVVRERAVPDVAVIGHTDRVGGAPGNVELGLKRANMARALLIAAGLDASFVSVTSHGETDLLVSTADDVAEPRNRRVEIAVR